MEIKHYRCKKCDAIFETWSDEDLECMNCGSIELKLEENFLDEKNDSFCDKASDVWCEWCNWCN
jgi:rRNA maturation endonuclease Nob1